jgi:ferric-dicitrate binding protein FerR (iron transport regulator)
MTPRDDSNQAAALEQLFVRYWDNALTCAEAADLDQRLASDPVEREWFRLLTMHAVAAAELTAVNRAQAVPGPCSVLAEQKAPLVSRRHALRYAGAGVAAAILAGFGVVVGRRSNKQPSIRLTAARGTVRVMHADGTAAAPNGAVPPGGMITTHGIDSSAVIVYDDGSRVSLTGDSALTVANNGRWLLLQRGNALADVRPQPPDVVPFVMATNAATLIGLSSTVATLDHADQGDTEISVVHGLVSVATPTGEPLAVVKEGELLTVSADGNHKKQKVPQVPDNFAWDLSRPLPSGWHVGYREETPVGPVVRPKFWFDPYHRARMSQIRSNKDWTRGFFRLYSDSKIRVRYWVDRPGPSQLCICVRTGRSRSTESGVVQCDGAFAEARPHAWQTLEVRAGDMLDNMHTPAFPPPWVGFLVIFNTYQEDLNLKIAEFRVSRPNGDAGAG